MIPHLHSKCMKYAENRTTSFSRMCSLALVNAQWGDRALVLEWCLFSPCFVVSAQDQLPGFSSGAFQRQGGNPNGGQMWCICGTAVWQRDWELLLCSRRGTVQFQKVSVLQVWLDILSRRRTFQRWPTFAPLLHLQVCLQLTLRWGLENRLKNRKLRLWWYDQWQATPLYHGIKDSQQLKQRLVCAGLQIFTCLAQAMETSKVYQCSLCHPTPYLRLYKRKQTYRCAGQKNLPNNCSVKCSGFAPCVRA